MKSRKGTATFINIDTSLRAAIAVSKREYEKEPRTVSEAQKCAQLQRMALEAIQREILAVESELANLQFKLPTEQKDSEAHAAGSQTFFSPKEISKELPLPKKRMPWSKDERRIIADAIAHAPLEVPAGKIIKELKLRF